MLKSYLRQETLELILKLVLSQKDRKTIFHVCSRTQEVTETKPKPNNFLRY
ncbi:Hypothetical predicted protein [Podarcis lilfordi]|uniref:Uncharacterized protein n=1 Tax=Podarcis lilfordi TaxID=74358 RepID=A0AA35K1G5_9SAUR|nr:Hypothetical predicted protein [Podarcis lilfordi]